MRARKRHIDDRVFSLFRGSKVWNRSVLPSLDTNMNSEKKANV